MAIKRRTAKRRTATRRRTPARNSKGRFVKKGSTRKRKSTARKTKRRVYKTRMSAGRRRAIRRGRRSRPVVYTYGGRKYRGRKSTSRTSYRVNPRRTRRRTRRRTYRRNPNISSILSKKFLWQVGKMGIGIAAGGMLMPLVYAMTPKDMKVTARPYLGAAHVALGGLISIFIKNKDVKEIGIVIAATGVYDLIASNMPQLGLPALPYLSGPLASMLPSPEAPSDSDSAPAQETQETSGYLGSSYGVMAAPRGMQASLLGASYEGLGGTDPYEGIEW